MRQVEYSIWSLFDAIWSTPYGHYLLPYGVLHMVTVEFTFSRALGTWVYLALFWIFSGLLGSSWIYLEVWGLVWTYLDHLGTEILIY